MTENNAVNKKTRPCASRLSIGQGLFCLMSVLALALTFSHSELAISSMANGMRLCTSTVIPALFPFMVLSELIVSSGAAELVSRALGGIFQGIFGIRKEGCVAFLLGVLCGFPIGTKSAVSLYENGKISKSELEHLITFCNGPSSAFLISAVGVSLFGSHRFGVMLYLAEIISAIITGIVGRFYFSHRKCAENSVVCGVKKKEREQTALQSIVCAVTSSASSMLYICAFVVFFAAMTGILGKYADSLGLPMSVRALMLGFFEMTGGVSAASELPRNISCLCAAAIVGWSGLSVHFQLVSLCADHKIAYRPYFFAKLVRGALDLILISAGLSIFYDRMEFTNEFAPSFLSAPSLHPIHIVTLVAFCIGVIGKIRGLKNEI